MAARLDTKRARDALPAQRDPHYMRLGRGRFIGLRKMRDGHESWTARMRDDEGVQRYVTLGEHSDAFGFDEAKAAAEAWFVDVARGVQGRDEAGKAHTVEAAAREYVAHLTKSKGKTAGDAAAAFFERRLFGRPKGPRRRAVARDPLASVRLDRLRTKHLAEFRERLLATGMAKASAKREMTYLVAALNCAVRNRMVSADRRIEWESLPALRAPETRRDLYLDRAQRQALLKAATGALRDLLEAAATTGARAGELVSARVRQLDARTGSLTLSGKTGTRTVPLAPQALALFARRAEGLAPDDYLLTRDDGRPWAHSAWDELVREAAANARVGEAPSDKPLPKGVCLYTLRHSWITEALVGGLSTLEVAKLAGTSLRMIEKHYGHLAGSSARQRLALLEFV